MKTTGLIAEDEPLLAAEIRDELALIWPELDIGALVSDGYSAWREYVRLAPQVLFLDVQMPGLDGLELAHLIGPRAHIIFVTAFDHFAAQAFDEGVVDYLVKPLDPARLARAVQRVQSRLGEPAPDLDGVVERVRGLAAAAAGPLRWITVRNGKELRLITVADICYFRADHKYVAVVTAEGEALIHTPLKELMERLDPEEFWQIHRGTVVNVHAVRSIARGSAGGLVLQLKQRSEKLQVSASFAHRFKQM
jgi:DNA-binding LytR/AlgR family response regulator